MEKIYNTISNDILSIIKAIYLRDGLTDELIYLSRAVDKLNSELKK